MTAMRACLNDRFYGSRARLVWTLARGAGLGPPSAIPRPLQELGGIGNAQTIKHAIQAQADGRGLQSLDQGRVYFLLALQLER